MLKTLAAEAHLEEKQFLLEDQKLRKAKFLTFPIGLECQVFKTEEQNLKPR
jgi:hypothetical protein